jgi:hypothetical protein
MQQLNPAEISEIIKQRIDSLDTSVHHLCQAMVLFASMAWQR